MNPLVRQTAFLLSYFVFVVAARYWARDRWLRRAEEERERRASQEREWKVGIPYDPEPERKTRRRRL